MPKHGSISVSPASSQRSHSLFIFFSWFHLSAVKVAKKGSSKMNAKQILKRHPHTMQKTKNTGTTVNRSKVVSMTACSELERAHCI
eukprot:CAMPEP_0197625390 /NCGR_PEP_ID=MMETSP1338-20131121/4768_1 /TAXON_ID=43686 ORGANISM="Pelagodinium beii, Strain RCC1491" /NCGR_SAMPLE_ID=MMETSP1338 /ASSEMBLY_ACC=CAM_ASM_000754 /LENGTH=85 /DNA_ID=CAMNT_0043195785 /DNA_START=30 /DNA_END=287 /DNA_ORIENTATION=-